MGFLQETRSYQIKVQFFVEVPAVKLYLPYMSYPSSLLNGAFKAVER
jgi:hypothetical protein